MCTGSVDVDACLVRIAAVPSANLSIDLGEEIRLDVLDEDAVVLRVEPHPRRREDRAPLASWRPTSPRSPFTRAMSCTRVTPTGRITVTGDRRLEAADTGERTESPLTPDEALAALRSDFGISLDALPPVLHPRDGARSQLG